jgi:hypothetical protein
MNLDLSLISYAKVNARARDVTSTCLACAFVLIPSTAKGRKRGWGAGRRKKN